MSNIPRGSALGVTMSRYDGDRTTYTNDQILAQLIVLHAGAEAEKILMGPDYCSSGASSDIAAATRIAYRMVAEFGMDPAIGRIRLLPLPNGESIFSDGISDALKEKIERRITKLNELAAKTAHGILTTNETILRAMATELRDRRTLSAEDVDIAIGKLGKLETLKQLPKLAAA